MLTSEKRDQVAAAAEAIQEAARLVRDLLHGELRGQPPSAQYLRLHGLWSDLEAARRRLLEAWS